MLRVRRHETSGVRRGKFEIEHSKPGHAAQTSEVAGKTATPRDFVAFQMQLHRRMPTPIRITSNQSAEQLRQAGA